MALTDKLAVNAVPQVGLWMRFKTERDFLAEQMVRNAFSVSADEGEFPCCADIIKCVFCNNPLTNTNK